MAITKIINIEIRENIASVTADVNNLDKAVENVDGGINDLTKTTDKNKKSLLDNKVTAELLSKATGQLKETTGDALKILSSFGLETKIASGLQKAYAFAMSASTTGMKAFRLALISTGIGAIVVALGLLIANFDTIQKYVQKAIDKFKGMGQGAKTLISFLFPIIGVIQLITLSLEKMGIIDDDVTAKAKKNAAERIKYLDNQKAKITESYDTEIRLAKAAGKDTEALEEAKRKAILLTLYALNEAERARVKSGEATEDEIEKWNERQKEIKKIVLDGKVAVIEAETEKEKSRQEAAEKADAANKKAQEKIDADNKSAQDKLLADRKAYLDKANAMVEDNAKAVNGILDRAKEKDIEILENKKELLKEEITEYAANETAKTNLYLESAEKQKEIDRLAAEAKEKNLNLIGGLLKNAANLIGESTTAGKALSIAATTIDTYQSATAAYKSMAGIPVVGPALGGVAAGLAVASGLANVKKILAVKVPGGRGGGGSAPSMSLPTGGGIGSAPQFNVVGNTGVNQIANTLQNQPPVQAIVVASNVTSAQSANRNIVQNASLG
jgi:hypothetical protein